MSIGDRAIVSELAQKVKGLPAEDILKIAASYFKPGTIALASSLGAEDQVLTHMIRTHSPEIGIFTIDTGRLPQETYDIMQATIDKYHFSYEVLFPDKQEIADLVGEYGPNLFYQSVELRRKCCAVRKVAPLKRKLSGLKAWVCGLRREQAVTRSGVDIVEWDEACGLVKINPIVEWTSAQVWDYIRKNKIPYNALHDKGFPSIGCYPCTRAVKEGEDIRAGRWWWESPEHKECGLHSRQDKGK